MDEDKFWLGGTLVAKNNMYIAIITMIEIDYCTLKARLFLSVLHLGC